MLSEDLDNCSLYNILENKYNVKYDKAIEKFKVVRLNKTELIELKNRNTNTDFGMLIRRTTFYENSIEYYSNVVTIGDIYEFVIELGKN